MKFECVKFIEMKRYGFVIYGLAVFLALACCSCEDFFDRTPDDMLKEEDNYTAKSNIYASFMGVMGTVQEAADHYVVMTELLGDLMQPTDKAPDEYWDVFRYQGKTGNSLIDPAPFYNIVMNCNDFLRHTVEFNKNYPGVLNVSVYKQMISGIVTVRAWAYLTIGKLYGKAVYYDYAMTDEVDLSALPVLEFDRLIDELIHFMNTGVDNVNGFVRADIDQMLGLSGLIWRRIAISPDALMCELYLWDMNYTAAAKKGINLITGQALLADVGQEDRFTLSYKYGYGMQGKKKWSDLFTEVPGGDNIEEVFSMVIYDYNRHQTNHLQYLFSSTPPNVYYLMPTNEMIRKFNTPEYTVNGVFYQDPRGVNVTYSEELGETVIRKYHIGDRPYYKHDAPIYIYRAAELHLMIAEALTALGDYNAADTILNSGFGSAWVTKNVFRSPFDAPIYAYEKMKGGKGVRGRVKAPYIWSDSTAFMKKLEPGTEAYNERRRWVLDSLIAEETARELAYEGKRWFTLMRMARNSGQYEKLAAPVSRKFPAGERKYYHSQLLAPENWFIRYDLGTK